MRCKILLRGPKDVDLADIENNLHQGFSEAEALDIEVDIVKKEPIDSTLELPDVLRSAATSAEELMNSEPSLDWAICVIPLAAHFSDLKYGRPGLSRNLISVALRTRWKTERLAIWVMGGELPISLLRQIAQIHDMVYKERGIDKMHTTDEEDFAAQLFLSTIRTAMKTFTDNLPRQPKWKH